MQKILILFFMLVSLIPIFYINKWFLNLIIPRKSLARLVLYILVVLELIFLYAYLLVMAVAKLFPLPNR